MNSKKLKTLRKNIKKSGLNWRKGLGEQVYKRAKREAKNGTNK